MFISSSDSKSVPVHIRRPYPVQPIIVKIEPEQEQEQDVPEIVENIVGPVNPPPDPSPDPIS